jgi:hypothetical protein
MLGKRKMREGGECEVGEALFDLLADEWSPLRGHLSVADVFMVRLSCHRAWSSIAHRTLTKVSAMELALDEGHAPLLRWCLVNGVSLPPGTDPEGIGKAGDVKLVEEYLAGEDEMAWLAVIRGAARAGHANLTERLIGSLSRRGKQYLGALAMKAALCEGGLLAVAQAIQDDPLLWHGEPMKAALRHGRLEVARWILRTRAPRDGANGYLTAAAGSGSMRLVLLVHGKGYGPDGETAAAAAAAGSIAIVEWLMSVTTVKPDEISVAAAAHGHVHLIDWVAARSLPLGPDVLYRAAQRQTVTVVRSLLARGLPYDPATLVLKACENLRGSEVLALLLDEGLPADPEVCARVAGFGFDAAILHARFALPLPPSYLAEAVSLGDIGRVRYAIASGFRPTAADLRRTMVSGRCALLAAMIVDRERESGSDGLLAPSTRDLLGEAADGLTDRVPVTVVSFLAGLGFELEQAESSCEEGGDESETSGSAEMSSVGESSTEASYSLGSDSESGVEG